MEPIKLKTWILWAAVLFILGVFADYYFLHFLFHEKKSDMATPQIEGVMDPTQKPNEVPVVANGSTSEENEQNIPDTFLESLKKCAPEIAAQAVGTPEALLLYLRQSIGVAKEEVHIENFHITLPDGSERRLQVLVADNTNTPDKKELRFFKLDKEGYPERLTIKSSDTQESLLSLGKLTQHESKRTIQLKDKSTVAVEEHNNQVYEFQFNNHGRVLSCRLRVCQCP